MHWDETSADYMAYLKKTTATYDQLKCYQFLRSISRLRKNHTKKDMSYLINEIVQHVRTSCIYEMLNYTSVSHNEFLYPERSVEIVTHLMLAR